MIDGIASTLGAAWAGGTRGTATLAFAAVAARLAHAAPPEGPGAWLCSNEGLALVLGLCVVEELCERDEDLQALSAPLWAVVRPIAAGLSQPLFAAIAGGSAGAREVSTAPAGAPLPGGPTGGLAAAGALLAHLLRSQVFAQLRGAGESLLSPRTWVRWLELGGLVGLFVALVFAPILAVVWVLLAALATGALLAARRAVERRWFRRTCPSCGHRARVEARRCPRCRSALVPAGSGR